MTSSIPAVKQALVDVLAAALPGSQVVYGNRDSVTTLTERVLLVGQARGERQFTNLAQQSVTESYTVDLTVSVSLPGSGQASADEDALADFETAAVAVNAHTFGPDMNVKVDGGFVLDEAAGSNGRSATVKFNARIFAVI